MPKSNNFHLTEEDKEHIRICRASGVDFWVGLGLGDPFLAVQKQQQQQQQQHNNRKKRK